MKVISNRFLTGKGEGFIKSFEIAINPEDVENIILSVDVYNNRTTTELTIQGYGSSTVITFNKIGYEELAQAAQLIKAEINKLKTTLDLANPENNPKSPNYKGKGVK